MKVRIVCLNSCFQWIFGKFVNKLYENLQEYGIEVDIAETPDENADVNHYIPYNVYECPNKGITTLMITHIDNIDKLKYISEQAKNASALICMSKETSNKLAMLGIDKNKLCYVNPAHDGIMPIRKIVIGWSCRVQEDGRKREFFIDKLANKLDPRYFLFKIMGEFWEPQVQKLEKNGFEVVYFNKFIYSEYAAFISGLDYYLYMGMDEGQMGFVDALAAGVKTIVTEQGYHLDAPNGITHPFTSYEDLESILLLLQREKESLLTSVKTWTWEDYTKKHIEIWEYLINNHPVSSDYPDGLTSLINSRNNTPEKNEEFQNSELKKLKIEKYKHLYFSSKRRIKVAYKKYGFFGLFLNLLRKIYNKQ